LNFWFNRLGLPHQDENMAKSLLEQLPDIVAKGRQAAEKILEDLEGRHRITLQTREWVLPAKDSLQNDLLRQFGGVATDSEIPCRASAQERIHASLQNRLIYGDNLLAMAALLAGDHETPSLRGQIDLIYIDPPFDSKADYRTKITLPGVELEQKPTVIEQFAYSDTWADGTASYLAMITPRLILMRELLSDTGSIYVHLDWHVGHYVKIVMDEIFGKDNFINEIVWHYPDKLPSGTISLPKNHDVIFFYAKQKITKKYKLLRVERDEPLRLAKKVWNKELGKWQGYERDHNGNLIYEETTVKIEDDVWRVPAAPAVRGPETLNFTTQKPTEICRRILEMSTEEGDLVADFFCGSGTTAAVAEKLGRRWITTDLGKPACMIMRKRLIDQNARPFLYQAIGDYQVEAAKSTLGRKFRIGDLSTIVLQLFGALPLAPEDNPGRNLGRIISSNNILVYADSPNKLTGTATLKKAIALRDALMGGWDKVVVLGWNFEPSIGETIAALHDDRLEVLVIPPDLLDRLKKKGGLEKLKGSVRFASLQYLTLKPVKRHVVGANLFAPTEETLIIELDNYVLLSPEAINLDETHRITLQTLISSEPLALIEYWAVDPDYDGKLFRSVWQDYRGNTASDGDPLRVVTKAHITLPAKHGSRQVCVRAVDVFGFEAEVVVEVTA
jgi:adenine-specific DNA-methyltransferase